MKVKLNIILFEYFCQLFKFCHLQEEGSNDQTYKKAIDPRSSRNATYTTPELI